MRRFVCGLLTVGVVGVTFSVTGCGGNPNPAGMPAEIKPLPPAEADALKKQFMGGIPKKKPR